MPAAVSMIGVATVAIGYGVGIVAVAQNNYAAANITVEAEQQLACTGLYGMVRHPMYFAVLIWMVGTPLALGSYWGLAFLIPGVIVLVARIRDEEMLLMQDLTGYRDYVRRVHHRLVPGLW